MEKNQNTKPVSLVLMCAGMSSRFGGTPKQLAKIGNITLIEYILNQALNVPFNHIYLIVNNATTQLLYDVLGDTYQDIDITYIEQTYNKNKRSRPWGTSDAVACLHGIINDKIIICNSDDIYGPLTFLKCYEKLIELDNNVTIGYKLIDMIPSDSKKVNRGIIDHCENKVIFMKEHLGISRDDLGESDKNKICNSNMFGFNPESITMIRELVDKFKEENKDNKKDECLLPTTINTLISDKKMELYAYLSKDHWMGVTHMGDQKKISENIKPRLLLFDVDGTLAKSTFSISEELKNTLLQLKDNYVLGIVGGSSLGTIKSQLGKDIFDVFKYVCTESGLVSYCDSELICQKNIIEKLGENKLQEIVNFCLKYIADLDLPIKRGTFIDFRQTMLYVTPSGRIGKGTIEDRSLFEEYDKVHNIRNKMINAIRSEFGEYVNSTLGGQIGISIHPHKWDKTYCLKVVDINLYSEIHFFGDRTEKNGNDYPLYSHELVVGHSVKNPEETLEKLLKLLK